MPFGHISLSGNPVGVFLFNTITAEQAAQAFYGIALLLQKICPCVNVGHAAARVVEKSGDYGPSIDLYLSTP